MKGNRRLPEAEMLAALHDTALDLAAQRALPDLLRAIVSRAVELLAARGGGIYLYRPETDDLEFVLAYRLHPDLTGVVLRRGEGLSGKVLESGRPLVVADYSGWEGHAAQFEGAGFTACVAVPIRWGDRLLGVLDVLDDAPRTFSADDVALLERFTPLAAAAMENARLLAAEREQRVLAETLREVANVLNSSLDSEQVLALILDQLARVVPYDNASIMLIGNGTLRLVAGRGFQAEEPILPPLPVERLPHVQRVLESRQPAIIADITADPDWLHRPETGDVRCWLGVPLAVQGQAIGLLNLGHRQPGFYTGRQAQIAQTFADQAARAIANARLYADLQRQMEDLKRTQAQLIQSAKMAAVGSLAAGVAHELNNPLTSILGFADLLLWNTAPDDPRREDLTVIVAEAQRARDIVRNLLDFSRQTESSYQPADVNHLLQQTLSLLRWQIENSHVNLKESYAEKLPLLPLAANRIKQVFLNLITNALHAMPSGGTLIVSTGQVGEEVMIQFSDTGTGIPADHLPRLFDPFFTTRPAGQGTGLGLSVSLSIVQEHGGRITVESQVGQGSRFTVWLPVPASDERGQHGPRKDPGR